MSVTTRAPGLGRLVALVALGGASGGGLRHLVTTSVGQAASLPVATLVVNLVGCLALGVLLGRVGQGSPSWRAFLGTGVLGGFTTWSTLAVELEGLARSSPPLAAGHLALSLGGGLLAARLGLRAGRARRPGAGGR